MAACGGAAARFASHLQRGKEYLAAGNLEKASVEFRNAGQIQPKNADALYYNGRVAEARGNIREAVAFYQSAVDAAPGNTEACAHLGKMLVFAGASQRALSLIAPSLVAHPDDPDLLAVRAAARHQLKQDDAALADAEKAVKTAPTNENAVAVLAGLYAETKDYARAISLVASTVAKVPQSLDLREVLTNLYLSNGQPHEAQQQMRKIIELKPLELNPRAQLAMHLARAHDLDGAQLVLEQAIRAFADSKQKANSDAAKLLLVDFVAGERSRADGEKTLRGFIAQDPDNLDLRLGLGLLLQRTGATSDAILAYQEVVKQDGTGPKGLVARDRVAAIESSQGHVDVTRKLLAEVLQKNPRDDDALILRADIELRESDPAGAIGDLRAVLRDRPESIPLQQTLAKAYLAKGDRALAEETLRALMQRAPNEVSTRLELAQLLGQTERSAEGLTLLEETVQRFPDSVPARETLIRAYLSKNDLPAAKAAAADLVSHQPKSAVGFLYAGIVAGEEKHFDESEKDLEHALELQPNAFAILSAFSQLEASRGRYDVAIEKVQASVAQVPNDAQLSDLLGALYFEKKDFAGAGNVFASESARNPQLWRPHRSLALVKQAQNDAAGAISEYEAAIKIAPAEPQLVIELADLYEKQGRSDDAIARYEALYKSNPTMQQVAANNLAMLLVTYKKDRASLDRARDLTSTFASSSNGSFLDTNGWVRFKRGEYGDAVSVLERAITLAPASSVIHYHLGMAELQVGQRDRARSNLEAALAGSGSFSGVEEARLALATLKASSG
jgi:tetratricopeptide (TPR) repeat protein